MDSKIPFNINLASVEMLNIGYIVTNIDHQIKLINHSARQILVEAQVINTLEELVGKLPPRLELLDHVKYCSLEHKSCSFREVEIGQRIVRVFLSPIFEGFDLRGNLLTLEDITEKIQQEKSRDEFLSFLVHELRTPLTAIHGNADLIRDYYKEALNDPALKEIVSDINSGSESLLLMVNQFLDMARLEEGRIEFDLKQFDAVAVARETVQSLDVLAKQKGLSLALNAPLDQLIQVVGDPGRVKQVLTNLIGNGLKFTEQGSITIDLVTNGGMLEIFVKDTGPGIPEESRAGMFQKFFQASNNKLKKDSSKSTGLGLYVTKLMVDGMGGSISLAETEVGQGSTFKFSISLATEGRLKLLEKQLAEAKQGVKHAPAISTDHIAVAVAA